MRAAEHEKHTTHMCFSYPGRGGGAGRGGGLAQRMCPCGHVLCVGLQGDKGGDKGWGRRVTGHEKHTRHMKNLFERRYPKRHTRITPLDGSSSLATARMMVLGSFAHLV